MVDVQYEGRVGEDVIMAASASVGKAFLKDMLPSVLSVAQKTTGSLHGEHGHEAHDEVRDKGFGELHLDMRLRMNCCAPCLRDGADAR